MDFRQLTNTYGIDNGLKLSGYNKKILISTFQISQCPQVIFGMSFKHVLHASKHA